jgi:hypothetical protein
MTPAADGFPAPRAAGTAAGPRLRTTNRMLIWTAVLIAGILGLWAVPAVSIGAVRDGFADIGNRSGPSVVAGAHLYDDLADMDGLAATMLMLGDGTASGETRPGAYQAYENDQADANRQLEVLGSGIDAIPGGPAAYLAVQNGLSQYSQNISQAIYIDEQARTQVPGAPPADALARYQAGTDLMHKGDSGILAETQSLITADQGTVDAAYYGAFGTIGQLRIWGIALALLLVIALIVVQRKLGSQFKRRINPPLALATVLTVIFSVLMFSALAAAHDSYVTQKADAFDSVVALWESRATVTDMNASESRWLLDSTSPTTASRVDVATELSLFDNEEQQVAAEPGVSASGTQYSANLDAAAKSFMGESDSDSVQSPEVEFTAGYLGTELANISFTGEQAAADDAFQAYDLYIDDDAHFRGLVAPVGQAGPAVTYLTGTFAHDFAAYTADVDAATEINQQQFAAATERGADGLGPWLWMPAGWALLTVALVLLGFLPRLREYRRG